MNNTSVIQGSKMSSLLYALFTLDTIKYNEIMKDKKLFEKITGKKQREHNIINHKTLTYVDDTQHVISSETIEDLHRYIQDLHELLQSIYKYNSLYINGEKTEFLMFNRNKESEDDPITIHDNKGNIIEEKKTIKILGYTVNRCNDLENHLSSLTAKITSSYNKIRGALPYMDQKSKKIIIESKLRGQLNLTLPLILNQNQLVQSRAEVILMKINRWIYGGSVFKEKS